MSVRRAEQYTITFAPVESAMRPRRASGVTFAPGDVKVWNGTTFVNATNLPIEVPGASGRYGLALTASEMDGAWVHVLVERDGIDPTDILLGTDGSPSGVIVADAGNTASSFRTSRPEPVVDYWKDCLLLFTSDSNNGGQVKKITGYAANGTIIVASPFTSVPLPDDRFVLINL